MTRRRLFPIVLLVGLAMAVQTVARADDVLDVIPGDALGFVAVNRLAETDAKVQKTLEEFQLPAFGFLTMFKARTRIESGLDERGTAAVVAMPGPEADSKPAVLVFLPVTDFGKLIEPFEPDDPAAPIVQIKGSWGKAVVAKLGAYAVATEPKHRESLQRALDAKKHVANDLAGLRPWIAEHHVVGVLTKPGVRFACARAQQGLEAARAGMEAAAGEGNPAVEGLKVYEMLFDLADEQVTAAALGVQIGEGGLVRITERVRFRPGSGLTGSGRFESAPQGLLAGLPAGPFVVAFGGVVPEGASEALMEFSVNMMKSMPNLYGVTDEQADQIMDISRGSLKGMRGMSFMMGVSKPGAPMYSNMVFSMQMDDAHAYLETYRKQIEAMNEIVKDAESSILSEMKVTKIDLEGTPGLKVEMNFPSLPGMEADPNFPNLLEALFGPGGKIRIFMAAADEHTVVAAYTRRAALRRCLRATKRPRAALVADEGVAATAALLPSGAPVVGYWSPKGTIDFVNQAISLFAPDEQSKFALPDFPETPPVGLAATISADEVQTDVVIPGEVLKAIGAYVGEVQTMIAEKNAL